MSLFYFATTDIVLCFFFFSSRRRHTRFSRDWSSDVCSSDLDQVNSGLVTISLGGLDSADLTDATELVTSLKDAHLRVLPVAGEGAKKDVIDLLFARGIDIGIVQTDVLASLKQQAPFPGVENFLQYITKLYDQEVHILARPEIHSIEDLASKPVNFGILESGSFLTASRIFGALGIGVEITTLPQPLAFEKLRR